MYNALWIHSLPYSKFIELTLTYFADQNKLFSLTQKTHARIYINVRAREAIVMVDKPMA